MRPLGIAALVAVGIAAGAGGAVAVGALDGDDDGDRSIAPVAVVSGASAGRAAADPPRVVVDDGVPADQADAVATAAAEHVQGTALTVDRDDGRYEVEVQRPDGAIVEVLLDGTDVIAVERGDGDG